MIPDALKDQLATLLGRIWREGDESWRLIALLPEAGLLVLESTEDRPAIQLDQFGRASHRAPELRQVSIYAPDGGALSAELGAILADLGPQP
jgi:hypothetical protein